MKLGDRGEKWRSESKHCVPRESKERNLGSFRSLRCVEFFECAIKLSNLLRFRIFAIAVLLFGHLMKPCWTGGAFQTGGLPDLDSSVPISFFRLSRFVGIFPIGPFPRSRPKKAPRGNIPERVRDTIRPFPKKWETLLETPRFSRAHLKGGVTEGGVFAFAFQYWTGSCSVTQMRHPLLIEGRPNCARQLLASILLAPRAAATSRSPRKCCFPRVCLPPM